MFDNHTTGRALFACNALVYLAFALAAAFVVWANLAAGALSPVLLALVGAGCVAAVLFLINLFAVQGLALDRWPARPAARPARRRPAPKPLTLSSNVKDPQLAAIVRKIDKATAKRRSAALH